MHICWVFIMTTAPRLFILCDQFLQITASQENIPAPTFMVSLSNSLITVDKLLIWSSFKQFLEQINISMKWLL